MLAIARNFTVNDVREERERRRLTPSQWATRYRVLGPPFAGPFDFRRYPWLREVHDTPERKIVIRKAAQTGFTETALNRVFREVSRGRSGLYILPSDTDAADFTASRLDPAIDASPRLKDLFQGVSNVSHKRVGTASLFVRGSRVRSRLQSVPCPVIVIDEVDECDLGTLHEAGIWERSSGQPEDDRLWMVISTPTIDDYGIDTYWKISSQGRFVFPCPSCGRFIDLLWERNLVPTPDDPTASRLRCHRCDGTLVHEDKPDFLAKGHWVHEQPDAEWQGFGVSQLYSTTVTPRDIVVAFKEAQQRRGAMQSFYNRKLGLPYTEQGDRLTDRDLQVRSDLSREELRRQSTDIVTMGVDVGKVLHYRVSLWRADQKYCAEVGEVRDFHQLERIAKRWQCQRVVIDANPETRQVLAFQGRFPRGVVWRAFYRDIDGILQRDDQRCAVTLNRTAIMDLVADRLQRREDLLPTGLPEAFFAHLKAPVRVYEEGRQGTVARWREGSRPDHWFHACAYDEAARMLAKTMIRFRSLHQ